MATIINSLEGSASSNAIGLHKHSSQTTIHHQQLNRDLKQIEAWIDSQEISFEVAMTNAL